MIKRIVKIFCFILVGLVVVLVGIAFYLEKALIIDPPVKPMIAISETDLKTGDSTRTIGGNWLRKSESGLYELYVEGKPYERGFAAGLLSKDLLQFQEETFQHQIEDLVPSKLYRHVLRYFIGWFNRDLHEHVSEEYKLEILGLSESAAADYEYVGPAFQRMLNYHAAHDIGHALQNMSLVACTSFATWGDHAEDGELIVGRNFDFYVGDDFAKNKIIAFYKPDSGYNFMMVTFGGMAGVLSGMNEAGLTVTINAAKSEIPSSSATPVSLVAREILQYASSIDEAYAIAEKRSMFVAESFLIGSVKDKRASIIEKDTKDLALYESPDNFIISTNHFQSDLLGKSEHNQEHIRASASAFRYDRVKELIQRVPKHDYKSAITILRDQLGKHDKDIGLGNERAINQLIAHHSIVFNPAKQLVWVSTSPWQMGKFVCYDLNKIFAMQDAPENEIYDQDLIVPEDPFIYDPAFKAYLKGAKYRFPFASKDDMKVDSIVYWNPNSYLPYMLQGDYYFDRGNYQRAERCYEEALTKEIATATEKEHIDKNLKRIRESK